MSLETVLVISLDFVVVMREGRVEVMREGRVEVMREGRVEVMREGRVEVMREGTVAILNVQLVFELLNRKRFLLMSKTVINFEQESVAPLKYFALLIINRSFLVSLK
jgi:hypothetical protein